MTASGPGEASNGRGAPGVRLDLNNPVFQEQLLGLQKTEQHAALGTLNKIRRMTWNEVYRDKGLRWEKILSVSPPTGTVK